MSEASGVRPFLTSIATAAPRALGAALHAVSSPAPTSPWTPRGPEPAPTLDTASIEEAAREHGRQQGLAETAELRTRLAHAIAAFEAARAALIEPAADRIAAAAATIVGAWTQTASPREIYLPIVRAWTAKHAGPATAQVAPAHVAALKDILADTTIAVEPDASLAPGDLRLSSTTLELAFDWSARLDELRDAITAALEAK